MRIFVGIVLGLLFGVGMMLAITRDMPQVATAEGVPSGNGDVNGDGMIDMGDPIYLLRFLHAHGPAPVPIVCAPCDSCCPPCAQPSVPATGQRNCYDTAGNLIDCASAEYPGQDGFYQRGCAMEDRFLDNGDGTVTDTCTGLMWQQDTADVNGDSTIDAKDTLQWQQALQYCEALEFAGHGDWRLPNVRELQTIVNYGTWSPAIDPIFQSMLPWYWSSTTDLVYDNTHRAWCIEFNSGLVDHNPRLKTYWYYIRAVRDAD